MKKNRLLFAYIIGLAFLLNGCILTTGNSWNRTEKENKFMMLGTSSMNQTLQKFCKCGFPFQLLA